MCKKCKSKESNSPDGKVCDKEGCDDCAKESILEELALFWRFLNLVICF